MWSEEGRGREGGQQQGWEQLASSASRESPDLRGAHKGNSVGLGILSWRRPASRSLLLTQTPRGSTALRVGAQHVGSSKPSTPDLRTNGQKPPQRDSFCTSHQVHLRLHPVTSAKLSSQTHTPGALPHHPLRNSIYERSGGPSQCARTPMGPAHPTRPPQNLGCQGQER